ncbi:MAG: TIGR00180 family glycosyltransferase [Methanocorpusculum sp.]|nr:TIGR00180 family glycosyltransferase [Methanocorpusculum sp.]
MPVEKIRSLFHANILYLEYEPETEEYGGDIYRKWADAVMKVKSDYSQICTDKEFIIPSVIQSSLEYLDEHEDYVCADGRYYLIKDSIEPIINIWRPTQKSIDEEAKHSRIATYTRYSDPLMAIHRSKIHKQIYSALDNSGLETLGFKERFIDIYTVTLGKYYHNPDDSFSFRDVTRLYDKNGLNKSQSSYARYPTIFQYPAELYAREYRNFKSYFERELDISNNKSETFNDWLTEYLNSYQGMLDKHTQMARFWKLLSKYRIIRKFMFHIFSGKSESQNGLDKMKEVTVILQIMTKENMNLS